MRVEKLRFVPSGAAMTGAASAAVAAVLHVGQTHKGAKHQPKRVSHVCGDVLDRMHHVANGPLWEGGRGARGLSGSGGRLISQPHPRITTMAQSHMIADMC